MKKSEMERRELSKVLKLKDYFSVGFGMIIGVGWIIAVGNWLETGGPLGSILGFIVGGCSLLIVGLAYAELTSALPYAGGEFAFAYKAFGNFGGFLSGWFITFAYLSVCAWEAIAIGVVLNYLFPGFQSTYIYTILGAPVYLNTMLAGLAVSFFLLYINYRGVAISARIQTLIVATMVAFITLFVSAALLNGDLSNISPLFSERGATISILGVIAVVPFFLAGFDSIPQTAEEADVSLTPKQLGKAILLTIVGAIVFYVLIIFAVSIVTPWQLTINLDLPTADVFKKAMNSNLLASIVLLCGLLGLISTFNSCIMAGTRVIFAMGRGKIIPEYFGKVHPKYGTPHRALIITAVITLLGPFLGKGAISPIVSISSAAFVIGWMWVSLSSYKLYKSVPEMKRPYKIPGGRVTRAFAVIVCILYLVILIVPQSPGAMIFPRDHTSLAVWLILGVVFYKLAKRKFENISKEDRDLLILAEEKK